MIKYLFLFFFLTACSNSENHSPQSVPEASFNEQTFECRGLIPVNLSNLKPCMDFRGLKLENLTFTKVSIQGSDFTNAQLINVSFIESNLAGSNFFNTQLHQVLMDNSNLQEVDMVKISAYKLTIKDSQALNTRWQDSSLNEFIISQTILDKAQVFNCLIKDSRIEASFKESLWEDVKIVNSKFDESNFFKSKILKSDLSSGLIEQIPKLVQDQVVGELTYNLFNNVDFRESIIQDSYFSFAHFFNTKFQKTKIKNVNFQGANLDQAAFIYSEIQDVNFSSVITSNILNNNLEYWNSEGEVKILKQKTSLNFIDASFSKIKFSTFDYVSMNNSTWNQSSVSYTEFTNSQINQNSFSQISVYQIYFFNNQMRSNYFDNSILGIEVYLSALPIGFSTLEFKNCDLQFSSFSRVGWFYYDNDSTLRFGPKFENSDLKYSIWNLADVRKSSFKGSDLSQTNLQAAFLDESIYNSLTFLPFSNETALTLGMIYE